ncbi:MAG TPA: hypothetical protein EYH54_05965 [Nautiliaceae bacterium]|nr:hypothetical protein [Nautiliaceae bacterium]
MRAGDIGKVTPGITESSRARVYIDPEDCDADVGSPYPGRTAAAKGTGVYRLKGIVSWVNNAVRQLVYYLSGVLGR